MAGYHADVLLWKGSMYRSTILLRGIMSMDGHASQPAAVLDAEQYHSIAAFRHELRRFLAFSEAAAAEAGLPPQQHQALLVVAGHSGPIAPTVGLVAQQLIIAPHTAAELVSRMVATGLLAKTQGTQDARRQELTLTPDAKALLQKLTSTHLRELVELRQTFATAIEAPCE